MTSLLNFFQKNHTERTELIKEIIQNSKEIDKEILNFLGTDNEEHLLITTLTREIHKKRKKRRNKMIKKTSKKL